MSESKTDVAVSIEKAGNHPAYDQQVKELLSYKPFLAWTLRECADEFKNLTIEQIVNAIDKPVVSGYAVNDGEQKIVEGETQRIIGDSTEDKSADEGLITYDIRFTATAPGINENIQLFVNVEAQRNGRPSYPLEKRMVYYLSRMISSQHGKVFTNSHYEKICKVYSIWIVSEPEPENANTLAKFSFRLEPVYGKPSYPEENYDMMTGVIVGLKTGDKDVDNHLLKLMNVLLDSKMEAQEKENIIQNDFNIPMTEEVRNEVKNMCNLSEGIFEDGVNTATDNIVDNMIEGEFTDDQIALATKKDIKYIIQRRRTLKNKGEDLLVKS